jgi:transcriptional regulator with XRE-family HTH domain
MEKILTPEELRALRKKYRLSMRALCDATKVDISAISVIESGKFPRTEKRKILTDFFLRLEAKSACL